MPQIESSKNVTTIRLKVTKSGWEQWVLLRSDVHHDNIDCRRDLETKHLEEAKSKNAGIIDAGDLFCAMQGKYDKRSDKSKLRPEHQTSSYLDALVKTAADDYEKYAKNFWVIARGNHETAIANKHETDLTERLVSVLNDRTNSHISAGGYSGWIRFLFDRNSNRFSKKLWYTHGYGGGGPVTQDTIQANRQMVYIEGADIMLSGHVHRSWTQDNVTLYLDNYGAVKRRTVDYIKTPTYKDEYKDGVGGFSVEKGHGPRPLGAYWIRFTYTRSNGLEHQILRAR